MENPRSKMTAGIFGFGCLLLAIVAFSYWPVTTADYIWDDDNYITNNATLRNVDGLKQIWLDPTATPQYYPLVHTGFWMEFQLWGLNPLGYHVTNVCLHFCNAMLVFFILQSLKIPGARWAAIVFAIHPVHVESVAWITERKNVLSGFFYLLGMLAFVRTFVKPQLDEQPEETGDAADPKSMTPGMQVVWMMVVLLCYLAAMLSKTVTASLPVALMILIWWKNVRVPKAAWGAIGMMFVIGVPMGLMTAYLEKHHVGAEGMAWEYSLVERTWIAGGAIWFYLRKLLFPWPIIFVYGHWSLTGIVNWIYPIGVLIALGVTFAASRLRAAFAAFAFLCVTLFPALGFIDVYPMQYTFVADHYVYLGSLGVIVFVVGSLAVFLQTVPPETRRVCFLAAGLSVAVFGLRTHIECFKYQNQQALWVDTIQKNPNCQMAYVNLGTIFQAQGNSEDARELFKQAVTLDADEPTAIINLATLEYELGNRSAAVTLLQKATQRFPKNSLAAYNLGTIYLQQGDLANAKRYLQKTIEIDPENAGAYNATGLIQMQQGRFSQAAESFAQAVRLAPLAPDFHVNHAAALIESNELQKSLQPLLNAIDLQPNHLIAHINLADVYSRLGNSRKACHHADAALVLDPYNAQMIGIRNQCQ